MSYLTHEAELMKEKLVAMVTEQNSDTDDEDTGEEVLAQKSLFTTQVLQSIFHGDEELSEVIMEKYPLLEQAIKFKRGLEELLAPYTELPHHLQMTARQQLTEHHIFSKLFFNICFSIISQVTITFTCVDNSIVNRSSLSSLTSTIIHHLYRHHQSYCTSLTNHHQSQYSIRGFTRHTTHQGGAGVRTMKLTTPCPCDLTIILRHHHQHHLKLISSSSLVSTDSNLQCY